MRTYEDNVEVINELWQTFNPTHELRQLFRERLSKYDQDLLYEAIKQARVDNDGPWPAIKWFAQAYGECQRRRVNQKVHWREASPASRKPSAKTSVQGPDADEERNLIRDFHAVIDDCTDEGFHDLDKRILDKYEAGLLTSENAYLLCRALRVHLFGEGPGLSRITPAGDLAALTQPITF